MITDLLIFAAALGYLCLLFAIAYYGDSRAENKTSLIANPYVYALSIAVYCTSWTFYGSVGRAASSGVGFLPIYIGPTLMFILGWFVLRKIIRISKVHHTTSIADFIATRYGKSRLLGALVTVIAVVGVTPYISLQLKAVSVSFDVMLNSPVAVGTVAILGMPLMIDTAFYVAVVLALFSILFGTRHIDATEHHEGMVAAIAFESVVKLIAFLAVGIFVTFGIFDGFGDIFAQAAAKPELRQLMTMEKAGPGWVTLTLLSMIAIICLPRQFQMAVVENVDESHLDKAMWLFPLYLLAINLFVLPIAFGGLLHFPDGSVDADIFVLALPLAEKQAGLALLVFIGGLSAATGMVIVATIALSTMISNEIVMPLLLRFAWLRLSERKDVSGLLLMIRRGAIILILLLGYLYFRLIGESYALVTIGLVSFAAAAQFAPVILGGIFWKGGSRLGATAGLMAGFAVWAYTLLLPSFAHSGWLPESFIAHGAFGIELLKPHALFGLDGLDQISHALFWSLLANSGVYIWVSLLGRQSPIERIQATLFVEVFRQSERPPSARLWRGTVATAELYTLAERFIGKERAGEAFENFAAMRNLTVEDLLKTGRNASAETVRFVERLLAGVIGGASARVMLASVIQSEGLGIEEIMEVLDETSQVLEYSRQLEQESKALEKATAELSAANARLLELDELKDEFLSTVSHELRTPLTSIRSFSEILRDDTDLDNDERRRFLGIIIRESERLTRLINQTLDLSRIEAGRMDWRMGEVDLKELVEETVATMRGLFEEKNITLDVKLPESAPCVYGDRDQLMQVLINLLSNVEKFCQPGSGWGEVALESDGDGVTIRVSDNGPGIDAENQPKVFDRFHIVAEGDAGDARRSGLGLAISRHIVEYMRGRIWVESEPGKGACFAFTIPIHGAENDRPAQRDDLRWEETTAPVNAARARLSHDPW